jgi:hypothetical protein
VSITSFRALTVAGLPAIIVVSLSQLAGASSLYQMELIRDTSSNVFGVAAYSSPFRAAAVAPKSVSDDGSDFGFEFLSDPLDAFGDRAQAATGVSFEAPLRIAMAPSYDFGSFPEELGYGKTHEFDPAAIAYVATLGPVNDVRGGKDGAGIITNPMALSFTAAITSVPEPENVGTAVVVLILLIAAFQRRVKPLSAIGARRGWPAGATGRRNT